MFKTHYKFKKPIKKLITIENNILEDIQFLAKKKNVSENFIINYILTTYLKKLLDI